MVFTDERTVFKCIDYWKTRMPQSQLDFLRGQVGRWTDTPGLYVLRQVIEDGPWAIITYDYEPSAPFDGGHEDDMIDVLNGCCAGGIAATTSTQRTSSSRGSGVKRSTTGQTSERGLSSASSTWHAGRSSRVGTPHIQSFGHSCATH